MPVDDASEPLSTVDATGARPACAWRAALMHCAFFCAAFAYLWRCVDVSLLYHSFWAAGSFPVFRLGVPFLRDAVLRPGGTLGYASAFLAQLYFADWSAALVIAAVATLLCVAARGLLRACAGMDVRVAHLLVGLVFLWPYNRYYNQLTPGLGVLTALVAAWAYAALPWRHWWARAAAFLTLALVLWGLVGGFCSLFAPLCGLVELVWRRRPALGAACAACGSLIPWGLGVHAAGLFWKEAFVHLWPSLREVEWVSGAAAIVLYALCLFLVTAPAALRLLRGLRWTAAAGRLWSSKAGAVCATAVFVIGTCVAFGATLDARTRAKMRIDVLAQRRDWEGVLREARRLPIAGYSVRALWDVNRALVGTGRLGDDMLDFPQRPGALVPVMEDFFPEAGELAGSHPMAFAKSSWLLLDLGRVNEAEQACAEALELLGRRPALLKHLFLMNVVKQRTGVALKFLGLLAEDPVCRTWARRMEARMRQDPLLSHDPEVQRLRAALDRRQPKAGFSNFRDMLKEELATDPGDRMALEYLMAELLLTKQLGEFAQCVSRLRALGFTRLPRCYEEAVLIYEAETGQAVDLGGLQVTEDAQRRWFAFQSTMARSGEDEQEAKRAAISQRNTYFFYFTFIRTPGA